MAQPDHPPGGARPLPPTGCQRRHPGAAAGHRPSLLPPDSLAAPRHPSVVWSAVVGLAVALAVGAASIGWVARDRAARQRQLNHDIELALAEAEQKQGVGNWPEARAADLRARSFLASGGEGERFQQRLADLLANLDMVARIEELRSDQITVGNEHFSLDGVEARFAQAFRNHGIDVEALPEEDAAARIREQPIRADLIAALDEWARRRRGTGHAGWKRLLQLAARVEREGDPWRERLWRALEGDKPQALLDLAEVAEQRHPVPSTVFLLAGAIESACQVSQKTASGRSAGELVVALLRKAQGR